MADIVKPASGSGSVFDWDTDAATPHAAVNHTGIAGVPSITGLLNESTHDALDHTGLTGIFGKTGTLTDTNKTCDASGWRLITIAFTDAPALITSLTIRADDGNATPAPNYSVEIYTDEARTNMVYAADNITSLLYEDFVPWEFAGSSNLYLLIINNEATAITDIDTTITYRK